MDEHQIFTYGSIFRASDCAAKRSSTMIRANGFIASSD
jgi:hypothetical protein